MSEAGEGVKPSQSDVKPSTSSDSKTTAPPGVDLSAKEAWERARREGWPSWRYEPGKPPVRVVTEQEFINSIVPAESKKPGKPPPRPAFLGVEGLRPEDVVFEPREGYPEGYKGRVDSVGRIGGYHPEDKVSYWSGKPVTPRGWALFGSAFQGGILSSPQEIRIELPEKKTPQSILDRIRNRRK